MTTTILENGEREITVQKIKQTRIVAAIVNLNDAGKVVRYRRVAPDGTYAQDREYAAIAQETMLFNKGIGDEDTIRWDGGPKLFQTEFASDDWAALVALCTK